MRFTRTLVATLMGAFLLTGVGGTLPVQAKTTKAAAADKAEAKTDAKVRQTTGEISDWSASSFKLKVGAVKWNFATDKSTTVEGKAADGARAQVKYSKVDGKNVAKSVTVVGAAKAEPAKADTKTEKKSKKSKKK